MTPSAITCVIPAYNRESLVARAVRSALDQTSAPSEIIIVDDGSTDGTVDAVGQFGSPVRCITQENRGCASARNRGVQESQTEWVAFLDSDDYWTPHHLEKIEAAISATHGEADYYFANVQRPGNEGGVNQWRRAHFDVDEDWKLNENGQDWVLRPRIPMMLQGAVFSRERFLQKGALWEEPRTREDTHCFMTHSIGYPVCAVRHLGAVMTADAPAEARLTRGVLKRRSIPYWEHSLRIWEDVLRQHPQLEGAGYELLRHRLFLAHWRLSLLSLAAGRPIQFALQALAALTTAPKLLVSSLLRCRPPEHAIVPWDATDEGTTTPFLNDPDTVSG